MRVRFVAILFFTAFVAALPGLAQETADSPEKPQSQKERASYIFGLNTGKMLSQQKFDFDLKYLMMGVEDSLSERSPRLTQAEINETMDILRGEMMKRLGKENREEGAAYLAENGKKKGVVTTKSGLQYEIVREGTGPKPSSSSRVVVHYRGTLIDGKEFDSSFRRGEPAEFPVTGVISGWVEALQMMKKGAKWKLAIPSRLAYGKKGAGRMIGPNSTLLFEVELIDIK